MIESVKKGGEELLSIGEVAGEVAISVDTIRIWEKRYGRPRPIRLPSGHRRYTRDHVRWLRRVAEALSQGHRPSRVIPLSEEELSELLRAEEPGTGEEGPTKDLLQRVRDYSAVALRASLMDEANRLGPTGFLERCVSPLARTVGRLWADGELDVRHEHFASGIIEDVLRRQRLVLREDPEGPLLLFATLPGERHGLGLQMAALYAVARGGRAAILGTETPVPEVLDAVRETGARAVCLSVSLATAGVATDREVRSLRRGLPPETDIVVGGRGARGARRGPRGVRYARNLKEFAPILAGWR